MAIIFFFIGMILFHLFAYDLENDRDMYTWCYLFWSLYFLGNSILHYTVKSKKPKDNGKDSRQDENLGNKPKH